MLKGTLDLRPIQSVLGRLGIQAEDSVLSPTLTESGGKDFNIFCGGHNSAWNRPPLLFLGTITPVCRCVLPCPINPRVGNGNQCPGPRQMDKRKLGMCFPYPFSVAGCYHSIPSPQAVELPQILVRARSNPSLPVAPCFGIHILPVRNKGELQRGLLYPLGESWMEEEWGTWGCFRAQMAPWEESDKWAQAKSPETPAIMILLLPLVSRGQPVHRKRTLPFVHLMC